MSPPFPASSTTRPPQGGSPRTPRSESSEVARRLGYRRNTIARALRTGRTLVVGMVVPDVANLYQAGITRGAGDVLYADGYSLILASTDDDPKHAESQVSAMLGAQAEGLLYGVAREDDAVLAWLVDEGIPVVLFNRGTAGHEHQRRAAR